jgi:hypothetical protein
MSGPITTQEGRAVPLSRSGWETPDQLARLPPGPPEPKYWVGCLRCGAWERDHPRQAELEREEAARAERASAAGLTVKPVLTAAAGPANQPDPGPGPAEGEIRTLKIRLAAVEAALTDLAAEVGLLKARRK